MPSASSCVIFKPPSELVTFSSISPQGLYILIHPFIVYYHRPPSTFWSRLADYDRPVSSKQNRLRLGYWFYSVDPWIPIINNIISCAISIQSSRRQDKRTPWRRASGSLQIYGEPKSCPKSGGNGGASGGQHRCGGYNQRQICQYSRALVAINSSTSPCTDQLEGGGMVKELTVSFL